jgi:SAM-dependent methyltransferase
MPDWNERYRRGEHLIRDPLPLLVKNENRIAEAAGGRGRALDLACGAGRHALFLAEQGWQVVAVDSSDVALELLSRDAHEAALSIDARVAEIESDAFSIEVEAYDLILDCCYLYRPLFPAIRAGIRQGGIFFGAIALVDEESGIAPMNPAFLLQPGELKAEFEGWTIIYTNEARMVSAPHSRLMAELIAQRL